MKLNISKTIDENIIGVDISVAELGTSDTDAATEKDMLHNFVRTIEYSKISFKSNMKADSNGDPVTTDSEVDGSTIISVELKDIPKAIISIFQILPKLPESFSFAKFLISTLFI